MVHRGVPSLVAGNHGKLPRELRCLMLMPDGRACHRYCQLFCGVRLQSVLCRNASRASRTAVGVPGAATIGLAFEADDGTVAHDGPRGKVRALSYVVHGVLCSTRQRSFLTIKGAIDVPSAPVPFRTSRKTFVWSPRPRLSLADLGRIRGAKDLRKLVVPGLRFQPGSGTRGSGRNRRRPRRRSRLRPPFPEALRE